MLTIVSFIASAVMGAVPNLLSMWSDERRHKHNIDVMKLQQSMHNEALKSELDLLVAKNTQELRRSTNKQTWVEVMKVCLVVVIVLTLIAINFFDGYILFTDTFGVMDEDNLILYHQEGVWYAREWLEEVRAMIHVWNHKLGDAFLHIIAFYFGNSMNVGQNSKYIKNTASAIR